MKNWLQEDAWDRRIRAASQKQKEALEIAKKLKDGISPATREQIRRELENEQAVFHEHPLDFQRYAVQYHRQPVTSSVVQAPQQPIAVNWDRIFENGLFRDLLNLNAEPQADSTEFDA